MNKSLENCPLCHREMIEGPSIDRHHLVPLCEGGKDAVYMHKICHQKIHATFTEHQLRDEFNTVEELLKNDEIKKFVAWISKKDIEFYDKSKDTKARKRRR